MLLFGLQRPEPRIVVEAAIAFGEFQRLSGLGTTRPLDRAASIATSIDSLLSARALFRRALLASQRLDEDGARERFEAARSLFSSIGNAEGEASCLKGLGDLALKRSDDDSAVAWYNAAVPLYSRAGSVLGMANCIQRLATIALKRGDLDPPGERLQARVTAPSPGWFFAGRGELSEGDSVTSLWCAYFTTKRGPISVGLIAPSPSW